MFAVRARPKPSACRQRGGRGGDAATRSQRTEPHAVGEGHGESRRSGVHQDPNQLGTSSAVDPQTDVVQLLSLSQSPACLVSSVIPLLSLTLFSPCNSSFQSSSSSTAIIISPLKYASQMRLEADYSYMFSKLSQASALHNVYKPPRLVIVHETSESLLLVNGVKFLS